VSSATPASIAPATSGPQPRLELSLRQFMLATYAARRLSVLTNRALRDVAAAITATVIAS
jgi:hypothetical protein